MFDWRIQNAGRKDSLLFGAQDRWASGTTIKHGSVSMFITVSGVLILGNRQALHLVPCVLLHLTSSIPQALLPQKFLHRLTWAGVCLSGTATMLEFEDHKKQKSA